MPRTRSTRTTHATKPKDRRFVEILALVESATAGLSIADICDLLNIETATANRDLTELRSLGIRIHSINGKIKLSRPVTSKQYEMLLEKYVQSTIHAIGFPQNIRFMVQKRHSQSLSLFTGLVNAIESCRQITMEYRKYSTGEIVTRIVEPYDIIPSTRDWRLVCTVDGVYKIYFIQNIIAIKPTGKMFDRKADYDRGELFTNAVNFYRGKDNLTVKLAIDPSVVPLALDEAMVREQDTTRDQRGWTLVELTVNTRDELVKWILGYGGRMEVLSPPDLRILIARTAQLIVERHAGGDQKNIIP